MHRAPGDKWQFNQQHLDRVREIVRRQLKGQWRVGILDQDDFAFEISSHVADALSKFSTTGTASLDTWLETVISNKLCDILSRERTRKRGGGVEPASLDRTALGEVSPLKDLITDPRPGPEVEAAARFRRDDVSRFIQSLPPRQRETALALLREPTLTNAARSLGIGRPALYDRLKTIRRLAEDFGLRSWLEPDG